MATSCGYGQATCGKSWLNIGWSQMWLGLASMLAEVSSWLKPGSSQSCRNTTPVIHCTFHERIREPATEEVEMEEEGKEGQVYRANRLASDDQLPGVGNAQSIPGTTPDVTGPRCGLGKR